MKNLPPSIKLFFSVLFLLAFAPSANGQILKKLGKKAEKAAERAVERRVEKETQEKTDEVLDSILEPGKKGKQKKSPIPNGDSPSETGKNEPTSMPDGNSKESETSNSNSESKTIKVYSKFDFVPGDKLLFFDDFSNDFIGDFPAKWNTNGSGEVITMDDSSQRWLEILPGYTTYYVPDVTLPEEYTIEFDVLPLGLDAKTSSSAILQVKLSDDPNFKRGANYFHTNIPFCQYSAIGFRVKNNVNGGTSDINNVIKADIRDAVINQPHISIAVNKQRFRLWVNEKKYVDIPRGVPSGISTLKFELNAFKDGKERLFLTNLKVAQGGVDLRRKLLSEGKISTNAILFESGSANLQPQSMGVIRQISQVLQQDANIKLKIIGHTDADGGDAANLELSKKRAETVMKTLINIYKASPERLTYDGKGEMEPVGDNNTADGKAQNRRVEFIKQ